MRVPLLMLAFFAAGPALAFEPMSLICRGATGTPGIFLEAELHCPEERSCRFTKTQIDKVTRQEYERLDYSVDTFERGEIGTVRARGVRLRTILPGDGRIEYELVVESSGNGTLVETLIMKEDGLELRSEPNRFALACDSR